jgi:Na+-driven multidrug efflux pump
MCVFFQEKMQTRLPSLAAQLLSKQWEFMKLSASFLSIAIIEVLMPLITVLFAGTISQAHLDGVGLATTMFNLLVQSMCAGYSSVFDTYGPQVYGSSERSELGTVLLKCLLQVWHCFSS